jgi:hypothetical protein
MAVDEAKALVEHNFDFRLKSFESQSERPELSIQSLYFVIEAALLAVFV